MFCRSQRPKKVAIPKKDQKPPLISVHFPKPYFHPNIFTDDKLPTKRLYIMPKPPKLDKKLIGLPTFMPTGPGKWLAGCKCGTFTKYPEWKKEKYLTENQRQRILAGKEKDFLSGQFFPQSYGHKTKFTNSILQKTNFSMNETNWKIYEPIYVKGLLESVF